MFFRLSFYWGGFFIQTPKANRLLYFKTVSLISICKLFLKDALFFLSFSLLAGSGGDFPLFEVLVTLPFCTFPLLLDVDHS